MSLTAISSLESARRIFFMNSTENMGKNLGSNVSGSGGRNESNDNKLAPIGEKKLFMNQTNILSRKCESNVFALRKPK